MIGEIGVLDIRVNLGLKKYIIEYKWKWFRRVKKIVENNDKLRVFGFFE